MGLFLTLAFLFFIGSVFGWVLELFFRRFISRANPERRWINPGFCTGPYVPLYGSGLCILFLIASLERLHLFSNPAVEKLILFFAMAVCMTAIEYLAGVICLHFFHLRLWDYSNEWLNVQGLICPKFSLAWAVLGAAYYFLIHPHIISALIWLSNNLAFSFFIGQFFGVFIIDVAHSAQLTARLKRFAEENDVIVRYETIKLQVHSHLDEQHAKHHFFAPFRMKKPLTELMRERIDEYEKHKHKN